MYRCGVRTVRSKAQVGFEQTVRAGKQVGIPRTEHRNLVVLFVIILCGIPDTSIRTCILLLLSVQPDFHHAPVISDVDFQFSNISFAVSLDVLSGLYACLRPPFWVLFINKDIIFPLRIESSMDINPALRICAGSIIPSSCQGILFSGSLPPESCCRCDVRCPHLPLTRQLSKPYLQYQR